ncbi:MAG TPA: DUF5723 family protein [Bacteroidales bacterium]|nr:DUF5723 family protein [Bacteroidales bacterium]
MIRKIKYILALLPVLFTLNSSAQNSQVLYFMNLPQRHLLNPALTPSNSVYIGLPVMSGINLNINNNFFNFSDVFIKGVVADSLVTFLHPNYDPAKFLAKIKDINAIEPEVQIQLFSLGFRAGKDLYINLDINEKVDANVALPGDIFRLALAGNDQFLGSTIDLSSLRGDLKCYTEIGLGFSKNFTSKLRLGIKPKMLLGIAAASIENNSLNIAVNNDYTHTLNADMVVNFSAPVIVKTSGQNTLDTIYFDDSRFKTGKDILNYLLSTKNIGFGVDIGGEYSFSDRLKVSAAITDIGYIKWKRDLSNVKARSTFTFSGVNLLDVYNGTMTFDSLGKELLDSLKKSFYLTNAPAPFTTTLPIGVTLGGSYNLTKSFSVGLLSYTKFIGKQFKEALTLSANVNFGNAFSTTVAYTAMNNRYDNLGLGISLRTGWFQFYLLSDRIPVTWNKIKIDSKSTIPLPESWNTFQLRLGMNLCFGNKLKKKNDKPMVIVQ